MIRSHPPHRLGWGRLALLPAAVAVTVLAASACTPATGTTQRVSVAANGGQLGDRSFSPRLSRDGRFVAFTKVVESLNRFGASQVFRKDRSTGAAVQVSLGVDGQPLTGRNVSFDISGDGTKVAWVNTTPDELGLNQIDRVFVRDLTTGRTTPVGFADSPKLSADGQFVAYRSTSALVVPGDTNGRSDVFVMQLSNGVVARVSLTDGGNQIPAGGDLPAISSDGRFVAFRTTQNLAGEDRDSDEDIYVRDTHFNTTTFASLSGFRTFARQVDISGDGRLVVFAGEAPEGGQAQTWVRDRKTGALHLISHRPGSTLPSDNLTLDVDISEDGRFVAFSSVASDLVPGDTKFEFDVFLSASTGGPVTRVSLRRDGSEGERESIGGEVADGGKVVLFQSDDDGLVERDTNGVTDVFVHTLR